MLQAIDKEWNRYLESEQPISATLMKYMCELHERIARRIKQSNPSREELPTGVPGLRQLAVQLAEDLSEVQQLIQQAEMLDVMQN